MWSFRFPTRHLARRRLWTTYLLFLCACVVPASQSARAQSGQTPSANPQSVPQAFFNTYCLTCHNSRLRTAGVVLENLEPGKPGANAELAERVITKLHAGSMPPPR